MAIKYKKNPSDDIEDIEYVWRTIKDKAVPARNRLLAVSEKTPKGVRAWLVATEGLRGETADHSRASSWLKNEYRPATKAEIASIKPSSYRWDDDKADYVPNPYRTSLSQPDLFTAFGDTAPFVPLEDLDEDIIRSLPRRAFNDEEWEELDEDTQEYIYEHDAESKERVDTLAKNIVSAVKGLRDPDEIMNYAEGDIDNFFQEDDHLWENHGLFIRDWAEEEFGEGYYDDETLKEAAIEVGLTMDNSDFAVTTGGGDIPVSAPGFYLDHDGLDYMMAGDPELYTFDELARAIAKAEEADDSDPYNGITVSDINLGPDEFWDLIHGRKGWRGIWQYTEIQQDPIYDLYALDVTWNEPAIFEAMREALGWEEGKPREEYLETTPEERIVTTLELSDGPYNVIDLIPFELSKETKKMNHCVGKKQYNYGRKIEGGQGRILSVRPVSGGDIWKRTFTLELRLSPSDNTSTIQELINNGGISRIEQVKGQRNRVPGFAKPGYGGGGYMERASTDDFTNPDEWKNMVKVVNFLGFNVDDVPDLAPGFHAYKALKGPKQNPPRKIYIDMPKQTFDMPSRR